MVIDRCLTLNEQYVSYVHNEEKCAKHKLSRWKKIWHWYGPTIAGLDRLLIYVTWTVFQLHSWRKQVSYNTLSRQFLHVSTCGLSIGVSVSCVYIYFLTCNERDILHTRFEPLIYVESEGTVVYLIRLTQPVDSHFGCDFTHYVYRELHKIFSFYCFRQCLFLFAFK